MSVFLIAFALSSLLCGTIRRLFGHACRAPRFYFFWRRIVATIWSMAAMYCMRVLGHSLDGETPARRHTLILQHDRPQGGLLHIPPGSRQEVVRWVDGFQAAPVDSLPYG